MSEETSIAPMIEAEQAVIGAILMNNDQAAPIGALIESEAFSDPLHAEIFETMMEWIEDGRLVSPVTIRTAYATSEAIKAVGGVGYFARLAGAAHGSGTTLEYAKLLADRHDRVKLAGAVDAARGDLVGGRKLAHNTAAELESVCGQIGATSRLKPLVTSHLKNVFGAVSQINDAYQHKTPIGSSTGLGALDAAIGALRPGNMILIAGRPAMGKTTLAQAISLSFAERGEGVMFGSLEMLGTELATRYLSMGLARQGHRIAYADMLAGKVSENDMRQVIEEAKRQEAFPIETAEREAREIGRFRAAVRRAKSRLESQGKKLGLVVVDYVQKMEVRGVKNIFERASYASDICKSIALDFEVPVIALAQLNRGVEQRDPAIPMMSDLRESGKLEEDSDLVLMCYRSAYYLQAKIEAAQDDLDKVAVLSDMLEASRNDLDVIVAKNRHGPTGMAKLSINLPTGHITDRYQQQAFQGF